MQADSSIPARMTQRISMKRTIRGVNKWGVDYGGQGRIFDVYHVFDPVVYYASKVLAADA